MKWLLLAIIVASTSAGDLLQSRGMKSASADSGGPAAPGLGLVMGLIGSRLDLGLAIACMAISFFAFLALVQSQPLSFAVPASAGSFVLETILAQLMLGEHVAFRRVAGAVLVTCGILLVAR